MHFLNNLSIRYKLLSGFLLICMILLCFGVYLVSSYNTMYQQLRQLNTQGDRRALFITLNSDVAQLSNAVKSYILTKDSKWERVYNTTSNTLQLDLSIIHPDAQEEKNFTDLKDTLTKIQGVELLILAKTKEGNIMDAANLFDTRYQAQQQHAVDLVAKLVSNEDADFHTTLTDNNDRVLSVRFLFLLTLGVIFLLVIGIGFYISLLIARAMNALLVGVQKIASGNFLARIPIASHDEFGTLGENINAMASQLQAVYQSVEQNIAEKTKELSARLAQIEDQNIALENTKDSRLNVLEDVEEEKEKNLDQAEDLKKYKQAVENASDQVVITDSEGIVLYANPMIEKLTGWTVDEAIGKKVGVLWGGLMDKNYYATLWDTVKNKKQTFLGEIKNKTKNGTVYYASISIAPILDEHQNVAFFVGIERDITKDKEEKQRIEALVTERTKELVQEQTKLQSSISSLPVGFIMVDKNNSILDINAAAKDILCGSDPNSPIYTSCTLQDVETMLTGIADLRALIGKCIDEKKIIVLKEVVLKNSFLKIVITPIIQTDEVIGVVILIDNITEAKILERTREEFFSIASHELRTPLTAIRGNASMIKEYYKDKFANDPELLQMVDDIYDGSIRLIEIVNDFLDLSRLEQGKIVFKKEEHDFSEIIEYAIREIQPNLAFKNLTIEYKNKGDQLPKILADGDRVKEI